MSSSEDDYPQVQIDPADLSDSSLDDPPPQKPVEKCKDVVKQNVTKPKKERTEKQKAAFERCLEGNRKRREALKKLKDEKKKEKVTVIEKVVPTPQLSESDDEPDSKAQPKKEKKVKKKKKKVRPPTPEPSESESESSESSEDEKIVLPKRKSKTKTPKNKTETPKPSFRFV